MNIEHSMDVDRDPREVFDFLAEQANWTKVDKALVDSSPHGPVALGQAGTGPHPAGRFRD